MKLETKDENGNVYCYCESPWTGGKSLTVNGKKTEKLSKNQFMYSEDSAKHFIDVKGNYFKGVVLTFQNGFKVELGKNAWYNWLFVVLPFIGMIIALAGIFGANGGLSVGMSALIGAIGGAGSFLAAFLNQVLLKTLIKNTYLSIVISIVITAAWCVISYFLTAALGGFGGF